MFADLVILNGTICTVDRLFSYCQAVAVRQGTIIDRGTTDQMKAYIGKDTKVIDAQGKLVLPGPIMTPLRSSRTRSRLQFQKQALGSGCSDAALWTAI